MSIIKRRGLDLDLVSLYKDFIDISQHQNFIHRELIITHPYKLAELCEVSVNTGRRTGKTEAINHLLKNDSRNIIVVCNKSMDKMQYGGINSSRRVLSIDNVMSNEYRGLYRFDAIYIFDEIPYKKRLEMYEHMQLARSPNIAILAIGGNH